jgi:hypothetical protein
METCFSFDGPPSEAYVNYMAVKEHEHIVAELKKEIEALKEKK